MDIKDLQEKDRPRERLLNLGPASLSDVELLAILIGSGSRGGGVFDIAVEILKEYHLSNLKDLDYIKISKIPGIKRAKACQLLACFELARRASRLERGRITLEKAEDIYSFIYDEIYLETSEVIIAIFLDCKLHPIERTSYKGNSSHCAEIPLRSILAKALNCKAYAVILAHNHPSGEVKPSQVDIEVTYELGNFLSKLDILLLDHLVVSNTTYYSFAEHGLLTNSNEYNELGEEDEKENFKRVLANCFPM